MVGYQVAPRKQGCWPIPCCVARMRTHLVLAVLCLSACGRLPTPEPVSPPTQAQTAAAPVLKACGDIAACSNACTRNIHGVTPTDLPDWLATKVDPNDYRTWPCGA